MTETRQLIDGAWVSAANGRTWDVIDPATEEVVTTVPFGGREDCVAAIDAAHRAFPAWSAETAWKRAAILKRTAEAIRARATTLAATTTREAGKPLAEAKGEWLVTADLFEWFAEEGKRAYGRTIPSRKPDRRILVLRQPIGVVGTITAWNFPAYNPSRTWAAALAAGCTVVGRPSERTPLSAMAIASILVEAGIPKGVFNLVNGEPEAMGQAMLDDPRLRKIAFTGSTRVGRVLMDGASRTHTRLSLELGGNAPVLVFPDADPRAVARSAVATKFRNAGQVCVAPQRFLVHRDLAEAFVEETAPLVRALRVGPGAAEGTQVGPLSSAGQRERLEAMVEEARGAGARVVAGGKRPPGHWKGFFYEPTLVDHTGPQHRLFEEEAFGPVIPVASFGDADEAIALANRTPYGLAAYAFTNDLRTAVRVAERLEFGMVGINEWLPHGVETPFPGWKQSGQGMESGAEGLAEYLETKVVGIGGL